jgi:hypothetical protein
VNWIAGLLIGLMDGGYWMLAVGYWLLAIGYWMLVSCWLALTGFKTLSGLWAINATR